MSKKFTSWLGMETAPKGGNLLRLLVKPDPEAHTSFDDSEAPYETIGFNNLGDTGDNVWQFAGWDWSHACMTEGHGTVIGWLPFEYALEHVSGAAHDVLAERRRQIQSEGWTPEHDDGHVAGELAWAAACYALNGRQYHPAAAVRTGDQIAHETWPWALKWFKPTNQRRDLVKAAALLLAEIERLDRAAAG
jgi:hypothetical protein